MNNFKSLSCGTKRGGGKTCAGNHMRKKGKKRKKRKGWSNTVIKGRLWLFAPVNVEGFGNILQGRMRERDKLNGKNKTWPADGRVSALILGETCWIEECKWHDGHLRHLAPYSHPVTHTRIPPTPSPAAALHADAAAKQTAHCRIKLWQRWNTEASRPVFTHLLRSTNTFFFLLLSLKASQFGTTKRTVGNVEYLWLKWVIFYCSYNLAPIITLPCWYTCSYA